MTRQRSAGYEEARDAGDLTGIPDIRVALAMWVPDATVYREGDRLVAAGTIQYMDAAFYAHVPTLLGPVPVGIDEGIFATLQRDGHWQPYRVEWVFDGPP